MAKTKIEWADRSWNVITGCEKISAGCAHCYAERMAKRLAGRAGYPKENPFEVTLHIDKLDEPLKWKKPQRIFVCSMSDLFHEKVPFWFIDEVFATILEAQHHTFLVLTKRPERMREYFAKFRKEYLPIPNVWLGTSVEDQRAAEKRIPELLQIPAEVRFLSCEPLLGPLYLDEIPQVLLSVTKRKDAYLVDSGKLDWVIVGGESGPKARPMNPDWVRGIRDQCLAGNIPFFFKQWGEWQWTDERLEIQRMANGKKERKLTSIKIPGAIGYNEVWFRWVGKIKAGRVLDNREWNEFPMSERGGR